MVQRMIINGICEDIKDGDLHHHFDNTLFQSSNETYSKAEERELPHYKRIKLCSPLKPQGEESNYCEEKGSAIGLKLRKTQSLTNMVEKKLPKAKCTSNNQNYLKILDDFASQQKPKNGKLKAANFGASKLNIGSWKRISWREGDLVAKCYYAKRKFVWEILEGALKNKIEIQWSDIVGIRATIGENDIGIFEIELKQPPLFFREINPQPKKHTIWQQASDFTDGQASICRIHKAIFPPGVLYKHFENILQSDERLFMLSKKPFLSDKFPYFNQTNCSPTLDFSTGSGPEFSSQYPIPNSVNIPHSHHQYLPNISRPTSSPLVTIGSDTLSVTDYSCIDERGNDPTFENQRTNFSTHGLLNINVVGDHNIHASQILPCPDYHHAVNYGENIMSCNLNNEILGDINNFEKQYLESDPQFLFRYDERAPEVKTSNYGSTDIIQQNQEAMNNPSNYGGMNIQHSNCDYYGMRIQQLQPNPCNYYDDAVNIPHSYGVPEHENRLSWFQPQDPDDNRMMINVQNYELLQDFPDLDNTMEIPHWDNSV